MVRTRIAPSPTGSDLHIGNLYTALINWIWARKNKGQFIVRIEDTDRTRLVKGSEENILNSLDSFGLTPDEGTRIGGPYAPYRQSERLHTYHEYTKELLAHKHAYYCFCTQERLSTLRALQQKEKKQPKYDRHCLSLTEDEIAEELNNKTPYVVRLRVPEGETTVSDIIRGPITIQNDILDDQVLLKSDGYPTYHLAVVIDDHLMKITHIIRGEEWLSSTPKHVILYKAFGWELPLFAHSPILRNPDKSKLSKRKNPVWASWYLAQGYLPEAVLNYFALMGWSHPQQKEIFSLEEFIQVFELKDLQPVGPVFDVTKLEWMNGMYIRTLKTEKVTIKIVEYEKKYNKREVDPSLVEKTIPLIQERIKKLSDYWTLCSFFFQKPDSYEVSLTDKKEVLKDVTNEIDKIDTWNATSIGTHMEKIAQKHGLSNSAFFMMLRVAITGKKISPPLNESMELLGKIECISRIKKALLTQ